MEFTEATLPEVMAACSVVEDFKRHIAKRAVMWAEMFHKDSPFEVGDSYTPVEVSPWHFPDLTSPTVEVRYSCSNYEKFLPNTIVVSIPREFILGEDNEVAVMYLEGLRLKRTHRKM